MKKDLNNFEEAIIDKVYELTKKEEEKKEEVKKEEKETLEEKIKKGNISFISLMSINEKKYKKENIIEPIKSLELINKRTKTENELLKGYIQPPLLPQNFSEKEFLKKLKLMVN